MPRPRAPQAELSYMLEMLHRERAADAAARPPEWELTPDHAAAYALALGWHRHIVSRTTLSACVGASERVAHFLNYAEHRKWICAGQVLVRIHHADALLGYATQGQPFRLPISSFVNLRQAAAALDIAVPLINDDGLRALVTREYRFLENLLDQ